MPKQSVTHERMRRAWYAHPIALLGGVSIAVGIVVSIWPAVQWVSGHYQTSADAKEAEIRIERRLSWANVQAIKNETLALRNRVNDCDILLSKGPLSPLERQACQQYKTEFDDATKRFEEARKAAMEKSK